MCPKMEFIPIQVDINLGKDEYCYIATEVKLFEEKTITKSVSFGGPVLRVKILPGLSYRVGKINLGKKTEKTLTQVDAGTLYITSKRLLFVSEGKSQVIPFQKILDISVDNDGLSVIRETGPIKYYKFSNGWRMAQLSHDLIAHFLSHS